MSRPIWNIGSEPVDERLFDAIEAIERIRKYKALYLAVLEQTGDREQAMAVIRLACSAELEREAA